VVGLFPFIDEPSTTSSKGTPGASSSSNSSRSESDDWVPSTWEDSRARSCRACRAPSISTGSSAPGTGGLARPAERSGSGRVRDRRHWPAGRPVSRTLCRELTIPSLAGKCSPAGALWPTAIEPLAAPDRELVGLRPLARLGAGAFPGIAPGGCLRNLRKTTIFSLLSDGESLAAVLLHWLWLWLGFSRASWKGILSGPRGA
jgi:hypothetical protein